MTKTYSMMEKDKMKRLQHKQFLIKHLDKICDSHEEKESVLDLAIEKTLKRLQEK